MKTKQNISSKFNKKQNKQLPLELLVEIFKLTTYQIEIQLATKRRLDLGAEFEEGSPTKRSKPYIKTLAKLGDSGRCKICGEECTHWSRHCQSFHSDFIANEESIILNEAMVFEGLKKLGAYVSSDQSSMKVYEDEVLTVSDSGPLMHMKAQNVFGVVVANSCINKAISLAQNFGIGIVTVEDANDYGIGQFYTKRLVDNGMVGFVYAGGNGPLSVVTKEGSYEFSTITPECYLLLSCFAEASDKNVTRITKERETAYNDKYIALKGISYKQDFIEDLNKVGIDCGVPDNNLLNIAELKRERDFINFNQSQ
uniref:Ferredoxin n=1 Tax=Meloidogyne hapla TaxID=6305 RepID=A0A1I8BUN0_MELHA